MDGEARRRVKTVADLLRAAGVRSLPLSRGEERPVENCDSLRCQFVWATSSRTSKGDGR